MSRSPAAAQGLVEELDRVIEMLRQFPEFQPAYDAKHRFAVLHRYPYSVISRVDGGCIRAIAFAHSRRETGYWQSRV